MLCSKSGLRNAGIKEELSQAGMGDRPVDSERLT